MDKEKKLLSRKLAKIRGWIQAAATLLTNIHIPNLFKGKIYQGNAKTVCVPGLNCYSCPAATGACPIGAFQAVVGSSKFKFSYYITGFFILLGVTLGRFICGFLCPFGWFQDLLHKIPGKKLSTAKLKPLRYLKYVILIVFVILLPMLVTNSIGMGDPFFCKYICPQGVLEGAIPLSIGNAAIRSALGKLFSFKCMILIAVIVLSILFYRPFCKWICPLGAIYSLFNKVSLLKITVDSSKCVGCGQCSKACKMDVDVCKTPDHPECIRCGACIKACPKDAICYRFMGKSCQKKRQQIAIKHFTIILKEKLLMKNKLSFISIFTLCIALSLTACGVKQASTTDSKNTQTEAGSEASGKSDSRLDDLYQQENQLFADHADVWNKAFGMMNKSDADPNGNYADYLAGTVESNKNSFTDDELKTLNEDIETIRKIEEQIAELENKNTSSDDNKKDSSKASSVFSDFSGEDFDGNKVDDSLFSGNAVTVVNFWFTGCKPCVAELSKLNELNDAIKSMGGEVVGINTETFDGNKTAIKEAASVLESQGVKYRNLSIDSSSAAGKYASEIMAFPTTILVDRNGNIVGEPMLGGIDNKDNYDALMKQIQSVIDADSTNK